VFALASKYPNPVRQATTIQYEVPEPTQIQLEVYNILGQHIVTLVNRRKQPGVHQVKPDVTQVASGTYFYRPRAGDFRKSRNMVVVK